MQTLTATEWGSPLHKEQEVKGQELGRSEEVVKYLQVRKVPFGEASDAASKGLSRLTHGEDTCHVRAFGPAPSLPLASVCSTQDS